MSSKSPFFYKNSNRALIATVDPKLYPAHFDLSKKTFPRILIHPADMGGCGHYRLVDPASQMILKNQTQIFITNKLNKPHEVARFDPDTVIVQRSVLEGQIRYIERCSQLNGLFTVYEIDDLLDNVQAKNIHQKDFNIRHFNAMYKALNVVDRLVCSTETIKEQYQKYCKDVNVQPNRLLESKWAHLQSHRGTAHKLRVGWAGGFSHTGDLEIIIDTVKALNKEVDFVFLGYVHPYLEKHISEYHAGAALKDYPAKLASLNLDIALAPLEDVLFNHAKSHLKVIEYGALGIPVIASHITPYKGFPVIYPNSNDAAGFTEALRMAMSDMDATYALGDKLKAHVNANWYHTEESTDAWQAAWTPS